MRRAIAGAGRTLVTLGLLILLFVVYQLWGTGIFTARAQESLKSKFQHELEQYNADNPLVAPSKKPTSGGTTPTTLRRDKPSVSPPTPADGDVEGIITIPKIGLNMAFVEGTSRDDLKKGPGHYPGTPLPGTLGNAAIAGHRTTYLHPFWGVDNLKPGDDIIIHNAVGGVFDYQMTQQLVVLPTDVWVVNNTPDAELTLTACTPKGSASHRIVIKAKLVMNKSSRLTISKPATVGTGKSRAAEQSGLAEGLSGQTKSLGPSIFYGVLAALVGLAWWWSFRRWRHPLTWLIGVMPFLVALFPFYVYLERALPSGY